MELTEKFKPLGIKAYGSIPHLPGSRMGPADHKCHEGQLRIATEKARDRHDVVTVQEKLDGSCVSVARKDGTLWVLGRSGYLAESSPYKQHQFFHEWVKRNEKRFEFLEEGERVVGEWLAQAHGTRYKLIHEPFVLFDLFKDGKRVTVEELISLNKERFVLPRVIHKGNPFPIKEMLAAIQESGHGAIDPVEGAVWRVERKGVVDFLCKYVRPDKIDGCYLPGQNGGEEVWNWTPEQENKK